ncbi:hypothetical protein PR003_g14997 [Phytophthora rubi]|uniref:RxLR effector protein n=1 Tax=Phytophthora rubi TaxID=129364 RepID=A0A6A3IVC4_9STRA|nr:hypothetical protein PR002_g23261 [Phytophthora rubi]KAE8985623.1 hypothetical protein PR001_g22835 [Phytophthora rubi]KAE9331475.1 hypothetical protein PR003_g14997 [Phytophthora rubi]
MRVCFVLLVAAAVLVGSSDATSTTNGIAASRLATADSLGQFVHQRRLLRAYEVEDEGEERVATAEMNGWISQLLNSGKNLLTSVDDVASNLSHADLKVIESKLANKKDEEMKDLVKKGWTPKTLFKELNIEEMLKSKTPKALDMDDNYKLYLAFGEYWKTNVNWLKKLLRSRKVHLPTLE